MNVLITGANGYIGQRLIPVLLEAKHNLICAVRNTARFEGQHENEDLQIVELDLLKPKPGDKLPTHIDAAYYLVHSMEGGGKNFQEEEGKSARRFIELIEATNCRQIIFLTGIVNEAHLSKHLQSRLEVEKILNSGKVPLTALRAGIIVGSGSASFEIIRDLVEKLPVMVAPKWLNTKCQPIAIRNVIEFLSGVLLKEDYYSKNFDIGGSEVLTYKQMLMQFAEVRNLKRSIFTVPVMTPRLSSYWLYFITSTSYSLASHLVDSMKVNVICRPNNLAQELKISPLPYKAAVKLAFEKIDQKMVLSSWKDAFSSSHTEVDIMQYIKVPEHGCFKDVKSKEVKGDVDKVVSNIWSIGGEQGWYYGNALWKVRGALDKVFGGVGLRRGRTHSDTVHPGDALDFWRVLVADKKNRRLLLFAEMKLPGEAWLEFKISDEKSGKICLTQTATFRPKGLMGRLYWYSVLPFHYFIFNGMITNLLKSGSAEPQ
jgi:uncharacterized protein YbjT (DUF2867 family)